MAVLHEGHWGTHLCMERKCFKVHCSGARRPEAFKRCASAFEAEKRKLPEHLLAQEPALLRSSRPRMRCSARSERQQLACLHHLLN
jgi:hypothetical protein